MNFFSSRLNVFVSFSFILSLKYRENRFVMIKLFYFFVLITKFFTIPHVYSFLFYSDMNWFEQNVLVNLAKASNKSAVTFSHKSAIKITQQKKERKDSVQERENTFFCEFSRVYGCIYEM